MGSFRREARDIEAKRARNENLKLALGAVGVVALGGGIVGFAVYQNHNNILGTYCKIGDHSISLVEFDFYYNSALNTFLSSYSNYLSLFDLDSSKSLSEQEYGDGMSWEQFFQKQAVETMREVYILSDMAQKDGITLDESSYTKFFDDVKEDAEKYSLTVDEYLKQCYGVNCTQKRLDEVVRRYLLAIQYSNYLKDEKLVPSAEEIEAFYNEHKDDYDNVTYRYYSFPWADSSVDTTNYSDADWSRLKTDIEPKVQEFFDQVYDEETFKDLCVEYTEEEETKKLYSEDDISLMKGITKSETIPVLADWLFDTSREKNATAVIEDPDNHISYVVFFMERGRNDEATADIRQCMVSREEVEAPADDATEEEKNNYNIQLENADANAKAEAERLYNEWKQNPTEDAFSEMANENSSYTSSDNGLIEGLSKGSAVDSVDSWVFDEARKEGDSAVVESDYGYHILYYIGKSTPAWQNEIRDSLTSERYTDLINDAISNYNFEDARGKLPYLADFIDDYEGEETSETAEETTETQSSTVITEQTETTEPAPEATDVPATDAPEQEEAPVESSEENTGDASEAPAEEAPQESTEISEANEGESTATPDENGYTYTQLDKTMHTTVSLNIRSGPSQDFGVLTTLNPGTEVHVIGQCNETNWYKVDCGLGQDSYASNDYLAD